MKFTAIVYDYNVLHTFCLHIISTNKEEAIEKVKKWINNNDDFGIFGICEGHLVFDKVEGHSGMQHGNLEDL